MLLKYIAKRLLVLIPTMLGVVTVVFFLLRLIPGDPVDYMYKDASGVIDKESLRAYYDLDKPVHIQYLIYLKKIAHLDFGTSIKDKNIKVFQTIVDRFPATLELTFASIIVAILLALPLGCMAAIKKHTWVDHTSMMIALLGVSIPNFWLGPLLIIFFSIQLGWFPVSERLGFSSLVLPAITLGTALTAILSRMIRSKLIEVMEEDYITTAIAKGLSSFKVIMKHGLKNALIPVVTILGLQIGALLAGAVITERIFDWPGIGTLLIDSIESRDIYMVQGCVLFISMVYVLVNLVTDLVYSVVDPRIRYR